MKPPAGKLDRRISIEVASETRDDAGDVIQTWTEAFKLFARRLPASGQASAGNQVAVDEAMLRRAELVWQVRWSSRVLDIGPETHRVVYKGRVYQILGLLEGDGRQDRINLRCSTTPDQRGTMAPEVVT